MSLTKVSWSHSCQLRKKVLFAMSDIVLVLTTDDEVEGSLERIGDVAE